MTNVHSIDIIMCYKENCLTHKTGVLVGWGGGGKWKRVSLAEQPKHIF
jgi:hypothetical protein